jgi:SAM-dependent methyltransferase
MMQMIGATQNFEGNVEKEKTEFWEAAFRDKEEMWGLEPAHSAVLTRVLFVAHSVKTVLIPGFGYGRNAQVFKDAGMRVTGIEISKTAIELARKHCGTDMMIHHGSVTDMPFDTGRYDGIFCYGLIHLLDGDERRKLIRDCYDQLADGGQMVFTGISKDDHAFGKGKFVSVDRYGNSGGAKIYFYDRASVHAEFDGAGLFEIEEVDEGRPFFLVKCRKG